MRIFINESFAGVAFEAKKFYSLIPDYIYEKYNFESLLTKFSEKILDEYKKPTVSFSTIEDMFIELNGSISVFNNIVVNTENMLLTKYSYKKVLQEFPLSHKMLLSLWPMNKNFNGFNIEFKDENSSYDSYGSWSHEDLLLFTLIKKNFIEYFYIRITNEYGDRNLKNIFKDFFKVSTDTFVHEYRHAYDEFTSNGKYRSDKKALRYLSLIDIYNLAILKPHPEKYEDVLKHKIEIEKIKKKINDLYYILPLEYWARLTSFIHTKQAFFIDNEDFNLLLEKAYFDGYLKLYELPKKDVKKVINKLKNIHLKILTDKYLGYLNSDKHIGRFFRSYLVQGVGKYPVNQIYSEYKKLLGNFKYFNQEQKAYARKLFVDGFMKIYKNQ